MHNVKIILAHNKKNMSTKITQKNMDNQNKKQKSPTNSPSSLAWRSLKEDKSWMGKLVLSSMHAKTWKGENTNLE